MNINLKEGWSREGLYWMQVGSGKDVLCIHGGPGSSSRSLWPEIKPLTKHFRLTLFDQQGCGKSLGDRTGWSIKSLARSTSRLSRELGLVRPVILGQSFGGFLAQELATTYLNLASAYIFSSTAAREDEEAVALAFRNLGGYEAEGAVRDFHADANPQTWKRYKWHALPHYNTTRHSRKSEIQEDVLFYFWNGERKKMDFRRRLEQMKEPSLTISGREDPVILPSLAKELRSAAGGDLYIAEGAGHGVWRDKPGEFFDIVTSWIQDI